MPVPNDVGEFLYNIANENCCLFLGSGFSAVLASYPTANELKMSLIKLANLESYYSSNKLKKMYLSQIATLIEKIKGRKYLLNLVCDNLNKLGSLNNILKNFILDINWRAIYTTNYDIIIESILQTKVKRNPIRVITSNDDLRDLPSKCLPIFKIHGCINGINLDKNIRLIISENDYKRETYFQNRDIIFNRLKTDLIQYPFLFAGFSMQDKFFIESFENIYQKLTSFKNVRKSSNKKEFERSTHFAISLRYDQNDINFWRNYSIALIEMDLSDFCKQIFEFSSKRLEYHERNFFTKDEIYFFKRNYFYNNSDRIVDEIDWNLQIFNVAKKIHNSRDIDFQQIVCTDSLFKQSLILKDLKLTNSKKITIANDLIKHSLNKKTNNDLDLLVQTYSILWPYLNIKNKQGVIDNLLYLYFGNDHLLSYRITQFFCTTNNEYAIKKVFSLFDKNKFNHFSKPLGTIHTHPASRFIRQLIFSIVFKDDLIIPGGLSARLLRLFKEAENPSIVWEIGVGLTERALWNRDLMEKLGVLLRPKNSLNSFYDFKKAYLVLRNPRLLSSSTQYNSIVKNLYEISKTFDFTAHFRDNKSLFISKLLLEAALKNRNSKAFDFINTLVREPSKIEKLPNFIRVSIPALLVRHITELSELINNLFQLITSRQDDSLITQSCSYLLWEMINRPQSQKNRKKIIDFMLEEFTKIETFKDDWIVFIYIFTSGINYSRKYFSKSQTRIYINLLKNMQNENRHILIRSISNYIISSKFENENINFI
ncbi:MAG: SIR2 family NAD-dependent protein deacylase [Candidatus Helarchaeota archaeon]